MSKIPEINDILIIHFGGQKYVTKIVQINNSTLLLELENKGQTSLTWNGQNWLLPGNHIPENVVFRIPEPKNWIDNIKLISLSTE